ncbi:MAG: antibiotic biosynthesis monooxygenase [Stellaceae bacterium]
MATLHWKSFARADPEQPCLVLLTYLPLARHRHTPGFLLRTLRITAQLKRSQGLLGYALRAEPLAKRFWTLSAWRDEESLDAYVRTPPHAQTMTALTARMGATRFIRWTLAGSQLPPGWDEALRRWREDRAPAPEL